MADGDGEYRQDDDPSDKTQEIEEALLDLVGEPVSAWGRLVSLDKRYPSLELEDVEIQIGRENIGGDMRVSRAHCKVWRDSLGNVNLKNLSLNGTFVKGILLKKDEDARLTPGDEIFLGSNAPGFPAYALQVLKDPQNSKKRAYEDAKSIDSFKCSICLSVWHDTVSVAPCFHNFCNSCFSDWYTQSKLQHRMCQCPQCRAPVISVGRNHTIRNLVEEFLVNNPSLRRSNEDIEIMEKTAMVKSDFMKLADGEFPISSNTEGFLSSDAEADDEDQNLTRCRQCERPGQSTELAATSTFRCSPHTNHLLCSACSTPLPERPDIDVPQKCAACNQVFCDAYWHSQSIPSSPTGCPTGIKLESIHSREVLDFPRATFNGNIVEQDITRRYVVEHRLRINDIVREWSHKLDVDEIDRPPFTQERITSHSPLCNTCTDLALQHLFYKFRSSIPKSELPPDAAGRNDCWYGYTCRTQFHKESHARKLNHVCEPSRGALQRHF